jgi:c-di-GMP-binding flagellar brake protein YcgR
MPMTAKATERRKFQRLPLSIPVFVRGTDETGKEFLEFATALNISAGGVLLATRRSIPKSASLALEIPVAPLPADSLSAQSVRSLKAKLVRVTHGERYHLLGLKFNRAIQE